MSQKELLFENWKRTLSSMEKELAVKDELIHAQKELTRQLNGQAALLKEQRGKLTDAGNKLSEQCEQPDSLCMAQQDLLEEFRALFSGLPGNR